ncbi:unnamed protein product [Acanthosepion pharaonis]|uniref:Uncharacterized protein n=1 Tax=Acanthosepion pharaonis TaxID=158019 RepID=A0A812CF07_ACAPH|nr:unnamed protein product [Sepia pharaonis]
MKFVETTPSNEFTGHFSIYRDATLPMGGYTYMPLSNASSSCHSYGVDGTSGRNQTKSKVFLTIFTTWDSNDKKDQVHANTLLNWQSLKGDIRVIVFINDSLNNFPLCTCPDCELWPAPVVGESGVPVLKHMFMYVTRNVNSTYYSYVNSDIVFNNNLIRTLQIIEARVNFAIRPAFIVGRRTNVINLTADEAASSKNLEQAARSRAQLSTIKPSSSSFSPSPLSLESFLYVYFPLFIVFFLMININSSSSIYDDVFSLVDELYKHFDCFLLRQFFS